LSFHIFYLPAKESLNFNHYCPVNFFKIVISYVFSICYEKNDCFRLEIIIMLWSDLFKFIERAGQCSKID
jgi:hypothetical protein